MLMCVTDTEGHGNNGTGCDSDAFFLTIAGLHSFVGMSDLLFQTRTHLPVELLFAIWLLMAVHDVVGRMLCRVCFWHGF